MPDLGQTKQRTVEFFFNHDEIKNIPQRSGGDPDIFAKWKITNIKSLDVLYHVDQAWTSFVGRVITGTDFGRYGSWHSTDGIAGNWSEFATANLNNTTFQTKGDAIHGSNVFGDEIFIGVGGRVDVGDTAPGEIKEAITLYRISLPIGNTIQRIL